MTRNEHIVDMFVRGRTYQEIGDYYDISRERVRQIIRDLPEEMWEERRRNKEKIREDAQKALADDLRLLVEEGCSMSEICGSTGLSEGVVRSMINKHFPKSEREARLSAANKSLGEARWTDEEIVKAILKAAKLIGPKITVSQYEALRASGVDLPSKATIAHRRTWNEYKAMAGLDVNKTHDKYSNKYSDNDYIDAINRIAEIVGRPPTISDYRNNRTPSEPSVKFIRLWAARNYENWVDAVYRVTKAVR